MAMRYKKKKIVLNYLKQDDESKKVEKFVAANVLVGSISYRKLCDEVHQRTGIHRSIVDVVMEGAQDSMITFLEEGFSVKLGSFGSFRPAINAESKDKPEEVNASTILRKRIAFTPGSKFRTMLDTVSITMFEEEKTDGGKEDPEGDNSPGNSPDNSSGGSLGEAPDPAA